MALPGRACPDQSLLHRLPADWATSARDSLAAGRLVLGSDPPFGNPPLSLARVRGLAIPDAQKALILGETLSRLCRLGEA